VYTWVTLDLKGSKRIAASKHGVSENPGGGKGVVIRRAVLGQGVIIFPPDPDGQFRSDRVPKSPTKYVRSSK